MKRLLILALAAFVSSGLFAEAWAANDRMFSGFARTIVDGLNAAKLSSLPANGGYGAPRIAVRTLNRDGGVTPDAESAGYTRRMLAALQKHGGRRFAFIALDALDGLIRDIKAQGLPDDEADARIRELRANARADVLVAGTVANGVDGPTLSYQAVSTSTGELLASTPVEPLRPLIRSAPARANPAPALGRHRTSVAEAEQLLVERGYDPGPVDGYLTPETREALRAYQLDSALPVNGRLTRRVVENLRRDSRGLIF
jgi:hypothetical protein